MPRTLGHNGAAAFSLRSKARIVLIMDVQFADDAMQVRFTNGRKIRIPLEWFPKLRDAVPEARRNWHLIGKGIGVHWPDLDEDLSLEGLLK